MLLIAVLQWTGCPQQRQGGNHSAACAMPYAFPATREQWAHPAAVHHALGMKSGAAHRCSNISLTLVQLESLHLSSWIMLPWCQTLPCKQTDDSGVATYITVFLSIYDPHPKAKSLSSYSLEVTGGTAPVCICAQLLVVDWITTYKEVKLLLLQDFQLDRYYFTEGHLQFYLLTQM